MKNYTYTDYSKEHMARAIGKVLPISFKQSVEICRFIKNKRVNDAKELLHRVTEQKIAVPFKTYNFDLGHKKKTGPARYPLKASWQFIELIESAEANAQFKGINTSNLVILHISAHKAGKAWHFGRKTRRKMKRTNIEIVVGENSENKQPTKKKEASGSK